MNSVKIYTKDSYIDLGTGKYFRLGSLKVENLLKKYRREKKKSVDMDRMFIGYVESNFQKFFADAKASGNCRVMSSIKHLGFIPEISKEPYTKDSLIDLNTNHYFRLGDLSPEELVKKYRKQKKKTVHADLLFITYVESNLQKFYNEAVTCGNLNFARSLESLGLKQDPSLEEVYTDDSLVNWGRSTVRLGDLGKKKLLKEYRRQKTGVSRNPAFIVYIESNLQRFCDEARACGNLGVARSIESLMSKLEVNVVVEKKQPLVSNENTDEPYTSDSAISLNGKRIRLGKLSVWDLLKQYRKHRKRTDDNIDWKFIDYVKSNLGKFYDQAKYSGKQGLMDSITSLGFVPKQKSRTEILQEICGKVIYQSKSAAKTALKDIRVTKQNHRKPIRSYECEKCGFWHHTSMPIEVWNQMKKINNQFTKREICLGGFSFI